MQVREDVQVQCTIGSLARRLWRECPERVGEVAVSNSARGIG